MLLLLSADFFQKLFHEQNQIVKQFGSRSELTFVGPYLGPNCLQMLSADCISRGQKSSLARKELTALNPNKATSTSVHNYEPEHEIFGTYCNDDQLSFRQACTSA